MEIKFIWFCLSLNTLGFILIIYGNEYLKNLKFSNLINTTDSLYAAFINREKVIQKIQDDFKEYIKCLENRITDLELKYKLHHPTLNVENLPLKNLTKEK